MFRHQIKPEAVLAMLCLASGVFLLSFMAAVFNLFDGGLDDRSRYMSAEDWAGFGLFAAIGLGAVLCGIGLFRRQRWAVVILSLLFMLIMLITIVALLSDINYFLRQPLDTFCILLGGCGLPLCCILLFNKNRTKTNKKGMKKPKIAASI